MLIGYRNDKLEKHCKNARKKWGQQIGDKLLLRLSELAAFDNLGQVPVTPPQRCHMLTVSDCRFSVDLSKNFRLIFSPAGPFETREGLGLIKETVKEIII